MSRVTVVKKIRPVLDLTINEKKQLKRSKHEKNTEIMNFSQIYDINETVHKIISKWLCFLKTSFFRKTVYLLFYR